MSTQCQLTLHTTNTGKHSLDLSGPITIVGLTSQQVENFADQYEADLFVVSVFYVVCAPKETDVYISIALSSSRTLYTVTFSPSIHVPHQMLQWALLNPHNR